MKIICKHCTNSDISMLELLFSKLDIETYLCNVCGKTFIVDKRKNKVI